MSIFRSRRPRDIRVMHPLDSQISLSSTVTDNDNQNHNDNDIDMDAFPSKSNTIIMGRGSKSSLRWKGKWNPFSSGFSNLSSLSIVTSPPTETIPEPDEVPSLSPSHSRTSSSSSPLTPRTPLIVTSPVPKCAPLPDTDDEPENENVHAQIPEEPREADTSPIPDSRVVKRERLESIKEPRTPARERDYIPLVLRPLSLSSSNLSLGPPLSSQYRNSWSSISTASTKSSYSLDSASCYHHVSELPEDRTLFKPGLGLSLVESALPQPLPPRFRKSHRPSTAPSSFPSPFSSPAQPPPHSIQSVREAHNIRRSNADVKGGLGLSRGNRHVRGLSVDSSPQVEEPAIEPRRRRPLSWIGNKSGPLSTFKSSPLSSSPAAPIPLLARDPEPEPEPVFHEIYVSPPLPATQEAYPPSEAEEEYDCQLERDLDMMLEEIRCVTSSEASSSIGEDDDAELEKWSDAEAGEGRDDVEVWCSICDASLLRSPHASETHLKCAACAMVSCLPCYTFLNTPSFHSTTTTSSSSAFSLAPLNNTTAEMLEYQNRQMARCSTCQRAWCAVCSRGDPWRFFRGEEGGRVCPVCFEDEDGEDGETLLGH